MICISGVTYQFFSHGACFLKSEWSDTCQEDPLSHRTGMGGGGLCQEDPSSHVTGRGGGGPPFL